MKALLVGMIVASALAAPSVAAAEVTEGTVSDPAGDSVGVPSQDILSAHAQYDSNGSMTVSATMNGPIASGPKTFYSFNVASYIPPETCGGVGVSMFGFSTEKEGFLTITGVKGVGSAFISVVGNSIALSSFGNAQFLEHKSFSCMSFSVSSSTENAGETTTIFDRLSPPLWFTGFGPTPVVVPVTTPISTPTQTPTPTVTSPVAPTVWKFDGAASIKPSSGVGAFSAGCEAPTTETCTFSLTLYARPTGGHASSLVSVGSATGRIAGGKSGNLTVRLNARGKAMLRHGTLRVNAKGTVKDTAGLVTKYSHPVVIRKKSGGSSFNSAG